jgi:quinolinate synthase
VVFLDRTVCFCATMNRIDLPHLVWAMENLLDGRVVNRVSVATPALATFSKLRI